MSGLYNLLIGRSPVFPSLTAIVGIHKDNCLKMGRIRDAWINEDATMIGVLHRNYGESGREADEAVALLPTFKAKHLCESDRTYGWYEFGVPEKMMDIVMLIAKETDNTPCMERYWKLLNDMKDGVENEDTARAKKVGEDLAKGLNYAKQEGIAEVGDSVIIHNSTIKDN